MLAEVVCVGWRWSFECVYFVAVIFYSILRSSTTAGTCLMTWLDFHPHTHTIPLLHDQHGIRHAHQEPRTHPPAVIITESCRTQTSRACTWRFQASTWIQSAGIAAGSERQVRGWYSCSSAYQTSCCSALQELYSLWLGSRMFDRFHTRLFCCDLKEKKIPGTRLDDSVQDSRQSWKLIIAIAVPSRTMRTHLNFQYLKVIDQLSKLESSKLWFNYQMLLTFKFKLVKLLLLWQNRTSLFNGEI